MIPTLRQLFGLTPWQPTNDETPEECRTHLSWWGYLAWLEQQQRARQDKGEQRAG